MNTINPQLLGLYMSFLEEKKSVGEAKARALYQLENPEVFKLAIKNYHRYLAVLNSSPGKEVDN